MSQRGPNSIRMFWERPRDYHQRGGNFGDELGPLIVERLFDYQCAWSNPAECEIASVGSIVGMLLGKKGKNRPVLWGCGSFYENNRKILPFYFDSDSAGDGMTIHGDDFDVFALRGTLTLECVKLPTRRIAIGDPGVFAKVLLKARPPKKHKLGLLPHFLDSKLPVVDTIRRRKHVRFINVRDEPETVIREIAECEYVISSSLHGLIVADSVGTPNAHAQLSNDLRIGGLRKFEDYYSAFSDPARYLPFSCDFVLRNDPLDIIKEIRRRYREPNDLDRICAQLARAFPY